MRSAMVLLALLATTACRCPAPRPTAGPAGPTDASGLRDPRETHLGKLTQLSYDAGENAEAYWSFAGDQLIFQTSRPPYGCDQIMRMPADGSAPPTQVSTGKGRTTCSYFFPGDQEILYASTHAASAACPPPADMSKGYVWALYDTFDIYKAKADGSDLRRLTDRKGYDAEATVCAVDGSIIFTSTRDGDIDLYKMDKDGGHVTRLTDEVGYDGGAFFSPDCTQIVWRASRPVGKDLEQYQALLAQGLVMPTQLELFVANADGTNQRQITYLGAASFAPYFFPSGKRVIFASNYLDPHSGNFDIFAINTDGTGFERITYADGFDGFPMFSPDGKRLAFASNRHGAKSHQTDLYVAEWIDGPAPAADDPADRYQRDVAWLADDAREGRGPGTKGLDAARDYLVERFKALGIEPAAAPGEYLQRFDAVASATAGATTALALDGKPVASKDFAPASESASASAKGATVAVGYGLVDKDLGLDDYKGKAVKGKVVVVRRHTPSGKAFEVPEVNRRLSDLYNKARTAAAHGAVAMIVVDLPDDESIPDSPLPRLEPHAAAAIPIVVLTRAVGKPLLTGSHKVALTVAIEPVKAELANVVGVIRAGAKSVLPGAIVIGAHYDHLGMGGRFATDPEVHAPHNGADDNASGTAGLLAIAAELTARKDELQRDVCLVGFSGEELGDLGSNYFVKTPPAGLALTDVVAMLNMDMIGRMTHDALQVNGGDSADEWPKLVAPLCDELRLVCSIKGDGNGPSDHMPFYLKKIPVLYLTTGGHSDYHTAHDDADKINAAGGARAAELLARVAIATAAHDGPLTYKYVAAPPSEGDPRVKGGSLRVIADYSDPGPGLLIQGVVPGGPGDQAGIKAGDRIMKMGDVEIRNIYDYMFAIEQGKPGDPIEVLLVRAGKRELVKAIYGPPSLRH